MSVLPMKRVFIAALKKDRKGILEELQRLGIVEINTPPLHKLNAEHFKDDNIFKKKDRSQAKSTFEKNASLAAQALSVLDREVPPGGGLLDSLAGRAEISLSDYEAHVAHREEIMDMVYELIGLNKRKIELEAEIPRLLNQKEALSPWLNLKLPLDFSGTKRTKTFIGSFPESYDDDSLRAAISGKAPELQLVDVSIISNAKDMTCVLIICHETKAKETELCLRALGFTRPALPSTVPEEQAQNIEERLSQAEAELKVISEKMRGFADKRPDLTFIIDYFTMRASKYDLLGGLFQSKRVFCLSGK